jgi:hypothetical protein
MPQYYVDNVIPLWQHSSRGCHVEQFSQPIPVDERTREVQVLVVDGKVRLVLIAADGAREVVPVPMSTTNRRVAA